MEGDTDFKYEVSSFGREQLEEYMKYMTEEYDLFVKHPDFFAKFNLYNSTMRPSSKNSSFSGGLRLKAFLNWCVKKFGKGKRDVRRSHLKGRDAVKYQLYDTISAVLSHCHDWQTLRTALAARGITMHFVQGDDGRICGITFTDNSHGVTLSGSKIDRSLSLVRLSKTLGIPENHVHLSSLISDRDETRTEVGLSVGLLHGSTSSNEWQHDVSASPSVGSADVAGSADNEGSSVGSNIAEAVTEVILQPTIAHTSGGGGGGNDRGWNDEDKEKNKKKRNGGMRR